MQLPSSQWSKAFEVRCSTDSINWALSTRHSHIVEAYVMVAHHDLEIRSCWMMEHGLEALDVIVELCIIAPLPFIKQVSWEKGKLRFEGFSFQTCAMYVGVSS